MVGRADTQKGRVGTSSEGTGNLSPRSSTTTRTSAARLLFLGLPLFLLAPAGMAAQAPVVTVDAAIDVTATTATITGTINPNDLQTGWYLLWGAATAYDHNGPVGPLSAQTAPVAVTTLLSELAPNTTYHYRLVATNAAGKASSPDMAFTTGTSPGDDAHTPAVAAGAATDVTTTTATLSGTVNPNGLRTGWYFLWGLSAAYSLNGPVGPLVPGGAPVAVSTSLTGLTPNTTYHYQLVATNVAGVSTSEDMTFTTANGRPPPPPPPVVTTGPALDVAGSSARLTGTVNPNGASAVFFFQWGADASYSHDLPVIALSSGAVPFGVSEDLVALTPGTTYHYRLVATNAGGTTAGDDMSFTTQGATDDGAFSYVANDGAITITAYTGTGPYVTIPAGIDSMPVVAIGAEAFARNLNITGVTMPDTVTEIRNGAFFMCANLSSVNLGGNLASIGDSAFSQCDHLAEITIPDSVTNISASAFKFCANLTAVSLGNHIATLGAAAFEATGIYTFTIPDSVARIEDGQGTIGGPFGLVSDCFNLTNVLVGKNVSYLGVGAFTMCPNLTTVLFKGNAPTPGVDMTGPDVFRNSESIIVYYLPGTTDWDTTYAGRLTMLWNPQVQADASLGFRENGFGFNISGAAGIPLVVESSTNLMSGPWSPIQTLSVTNGLLHFSDPGPTNCPARFYRLRLP